MPVAIHVRTPWRPLALVVASSVVLLAVGPGRVTGADDARRRAEERRQARAEVSLARSRFATTTTLPADPVLAAAHRLVDERSPAALAEVAAAMAATGDPGWVPFLVDLVRVVATPETVAPLARALAILTGEPVPPPEDVYRVFGDWYYREAPAPAAGYVEWKARLYGTLDVRFAKVLRPASPEVAARLQWGGVRFGGIPELEEPRVVVDPPWLADDELVFGAVVGGEARAYPLRIVDRHELVDDVLGGEPVVLADCTLCRTGALFSRRVGERVLRFRTSGLLWNSNKVMVDDTTRTLWVQLSGEAVAGPLEGAVLTRLALETATAADWLAEHPGSGVVDMPTGTGFDYTPGAAYAEYLADPERWYPAFVSGTGPPDKTLVATVEVDGYPLAVVVDALAASGPRWLTVGGQAVFAVPTAVDVRFYGGGGPDEVVDVDAARAVLADGSSLPRLQSGRSFWFAWFSAHPDTSLWPDS